MRFHPISDSLFTFVTAGLIADDKDLPGFDQVPAIVNQSDTATAFIARIDRQNRAIPDRRLQQQILQVVSEHFNSMTFGLFSNVASNLSFDTRQ